MSNGTSGYRPRSFFFPILMVIIGVLFLGRNMGWFPGFWPLFVRFWPLLLILWGVVKLLEYIWARSKGQPAPGIGAGGVVFLVFFILFGMAATRASRVDWQGMGVNVDDVDVVDPFGLFGASHEFTENFSQAMTPGGQVRVLVTRGSVSVSASPDSQAHAFVHKYLRAYSDDEASKNNEATHPKLVQQGDLWLLDLTGGPYQQGRFDLDLQLPATSPVSLSTRHGDLHVSQRAADVTLDSTHGDLTAEDVKGNASLHLRHGDVTVKSITGDTTVDGFVSDINVSDVKGAVTLTGTYVGEIQLAHIDKQVRFNSTRTDLQFAQLPGELTIDRGDMRGNQITGPFRLNAQAKDINLEDVEGDIHIENRRGDVNIRAKSPLGPIDVDNSNGDITIGLPEKPGFQIDAQSNQGEIHSDFGLEVKSGRNVTASGSIGKGSPTVRLKTNRGTIQINKL